MLPAETRLFTEKLFSTLEFSHLELFVSVSDSNVISPQITFSSMCWLPPIIEIVEMIKKNNAMLNINKSFYGAVIDDEMRFSTPTLSKEIISHSHSHTHAHRHVHAFYSINFFLKQFFIKEVLAFHSICFINPSMRQ